MQRAAWPLQASKQMLCLQCLKEKFSTCLTLLHSGLHCKQEWEKGQTNIKSRICWRVKKYFIHINIHVCDCWCMRVSISKNTNINSHQIISVASGLKLWLSKCPTHPIFNWLLYQVYLLFPCHLFSSKTSMCLLAETPIYHLISVFGPNFLPKVLWMDSENRVQVHHLWYITHAKCGKSLMPPVDKFLICYGIPLYFLWLSSIVFHPILVYVLFYHTSFFSLLPFYSKER